MRTTKLALFIAVLAVGHAAAQERTVTVNEGPTPVLTVRLPQAAKVSRKRDAAGEITSLHITGTVVHLWTVGHATTVDAALTGVPGTIKAEFLNFAARTTNDVTIAGARAKHLVGVGNEADDGDPSKAEVVVFGAAGRVFVACIHGYELTPKDRGAMMAVVATARAPAKGR